MEKIAGINIGGKIFRYPDTLCRTSAGFLINFHDGSDTWKGVFPEYSWDDFFDAILLDLHQDINPNTIVERQIVPTIIKPSKPIGVCQRRFCNLQTEYEYCSLICWRTQLTNGIKTNMLTADKNDLLHNARLLKNLETICETLYNLVPSMDR